MEKNTSITKYDAYDIRCFHPVISRERRTDNIRWVRPASRIWYDNLRVGDGSTR